MVAGGDKALGLGAGEVPGSRRWRRLGFGAVDGFGHHVRAERMFGALPGVVKLEAPLVEVGIGRE
jgi:hypothetical protein